MQAAESAGTGMFPYKYFNASNTSNEGYVDTTETNASTLQAQIDSINNFYKKWVNQNVDIDFLNVYEYRVPRSRFSGDRLDSKTDLLKYSDVVDTRLAGQNVPDPATGTAAQDTSIWNLEFDFNITIVTKVMKWNVDQFKVSHGCELKVLGFKILSVCGYVEKKATPMIQKFENQITDVDAPKILKKI